MKIEIITSYFEPYKGGIENVVLHYAEGLGRLGHKVCVHTGDSTPGGTYKNLPRYEKHKYYVVKRYKIFPYSLFFPKLIYEDSIVSLHNYSCLMNDYVSLMYPGRKKVLSPYGNISYDLNQRQHQNLAPIYDKLIGRRTLDAVDKIVAMTSHEKKGIIKKYPNLKSKVSIVPAGIDFIKINPPTVKRRFSFKYFISVGRITHTKRFEDVLSIMKDFPDYHYVLAGRDIGHAQVLLKLATDLGIEKRFHYVGEVSEKEKVSLLHNGDIFIMPDSANAFGIANLEAFYYLGRVIATRSGGIVELSKELGGELYKVGNLNGLKNALKIEFDKKLDKNLLAKKRKIIEDKYSWDSVVKEYEKILLK